MGTCLGPGHRSEGSRDPDVSSSLYMTQALLRCRKAVNVKIMHPRQRFLLLFLSDYSVFPELSFAFLKVRGSKVV